jgi:hypothetical protein
MVGPSAWPVRCLPATDQRSAPYAVDDSARVPLSLVRAVSRVVAFVGCKNPPSDERCLLGIAVAGAAGKDSVFPLPTMSRSAASYQSMMALIVVCQTLRTPHQMKLDWTKQDICKPGIALDRARPRDAH